MAGLGQIERFPRSEPSDSFRLDDSTFPERSAMGAERRERLLVTRRLAEANGNIVPPVGGPRLSMCRCCAARHSVVREAAQTYLSKTIPTRDEPAVTSRVIHIACRGSASAQ